MIDTKQLLGEWDNIKKILEGVVAFQDEIVSLKKDRNALKSEVEAISSEIAKRKDDADKALEAVNIEKDEAIKEIAGKKKHYDDQFNRRAEALDKREADVSRQASEAQELIVKSRNMLMEANEASRKMEAVREELDERQLKLDLKDARLTSLEAALYAQEKNIMLLQEENRNAEARIKNELEDIKKATEYVNKQNGLIAEERKAFEDYRKKLDKDVISSEALVKKSNDRWLSLERYSDELDSRAAEIERKKKDLSDKEKSLMALADVLKREQKNA